MRTRNNRKIVNLSSILVLIFVLLISIGYSSYSSNLYIFNSVATVRADKNVRITGLSINGSTNGGVSDAEEYDVKTISSDIRLPQANSTITYQVEVKNYGNVEMGIESISLPDELKNILEVSVDGYTLGDKIRDNNDACENSVDGCKLSIKRTFNVTIGYKNGQYDSNNYIFNNILLNFEFKQMHKVTYTGFTIFTPPNSARTIMDGHTFSQNIGPYDTLLIRIGGVTNTNYTIDSNNLLTIPNVEDDVEIIISEVMLPVVINSVPNNANIEYKINGVSVSSVTGTLNTNIAIGSTLEVTLTAYGYKQKTKTYTVNTELTDTISMDAIYYLNLNVTPNDAVISYKVNNVTKDPVSGLLSGEFDPGTTVDVTITKANYKTFTKTYTMNSHISENINLTRQYTYIANAVSPAGQTIKMSQNGGTSQTIVSGTSYLIDEGTELSITSSASGYRTKTITHTMNSDYTDNFTLTKTYIYKVNATKPTNATLYLTINNGTRTSVSSGYSVELDVNSTVKLEASATNYKSATYNHTMTSNITDTVSLIRLYTYKVSCSNKSDANITITYDGQNYTGSGSKSITVEENKTVSWLISRDYYQSQSGSTSSVTGDVTQNKTLSLNPVQYKSASRDDNLGLGSTSETMSITGIPSTAKIVSGTLSGSFRASIRNGTINVETKSANNVQLWYKATDGKILSDTNINASYSCSNYTTNIDACPASGGTVTTEFTKAWGVIITVRSDITVKIGYIEK